MGYDFELGGEEAVVFAIADALSIEGERVRAKLHPAPGAHEHVLEIEGEHEPVFVASQGDLHYVHLRGRVHRVRAIDALERARHAADPGGGAEVLRAPMPGTVVSVAAAAGDAVEAGQLLMTIESMKLQTAITAPRDARIAEVCVADGDTFDQGDALVRLEAEEEEATGNAEGATR